MKNSSFITKLTITFIFMTFTFSVNAVTDCDKVVDMMCQVFKNMITEVNNCNSIDEFSNIDFNKSLDGINFNSIPDSCTEYKLTKSDKIKLNGSIDDLTNSMVNKMYQLTGGMVTKEYIRTILNEQMNSMKVAVDKSVTLGDLADRFSSL